MNLPIQRAAYVASISEFLAESASAIVGQLSSASEGDVAAEQIAAWGQQVDLLHSALLPSMQGMVCFEFTIPRIGRRVDNVLLLGNRVLVLEFKVGAKHYDAAAQTQVLDYALDLKNFHTASHDAPIAPILVATAAPAHSYAYAYPVVGCIPSSNAMPPR